MSIDAVHLHREVYNNNRFEEEKKKMTFLGKTELSREKNRRKSSKKEGGGAESHCRVIEQKTEEVEVMRGYYMVFIELKGIISTIMTAIFEQYKDY